MKEKSCKPVYRIIFLSLTGLTIVFAFVHSSMPAEYSDEESLAVLGFLQDFLGIFGIGEELTNHIIRKSAHFLEYTAIGALAMTSAYTFSKRKLYGYFPHVLLTGLLSAVIDEAIQLNVEGRSGQITDVLLDFSGVITGSALMFAIFLAANALRKRKKSK